MPAERATFASNSAITGPDSQNLMRDATRLVRVGLAMAAPVSVHAESASGRVHRPDCGCEKGRELDLTAELFGLQLGILR